MNHKIVSLFATAALGVLAVNDSTFAQGTAFTYQGRLDANGGSANGNFDFTFALFNNSGTNSGQIANTLTNLGVGVTNGLFTVPLDFGPGVFTGGSNWLAIAVRTNGGTSFTALSPSQKLTPTPYAIFAPNAGIAASASSVAASNIVGSVPLAQLPAAVVTNNESSVTLSNLTLNGNLNLPFNNGNTPLGYVTLNANTTGFNNTAIGGYALSKNTNGVDNTGVGYQALTSNVIGSYNTAVGLYAMRANISGVHNTASGFFALLGNTNGNYNTGMGDNALVSNNGSYNIALGNSAGANLTSNESYNIDIGNSGTTGESGVIRIGTPGTHTNTVIAGVINGNGAGLTNINVSQLTATGGNYNLRNFFAGPAAGNTNTTGPNNTATGFSALGANTSGYHNTANGDQSLANNTSGGNNTAVGYSALQQNTGGFDNTAVGQGALFANQNGIFNSAFGDESLVYNTTGSGNTGSGFYSLNGNISGNNNTAIGTHTLDSVTNGTGNIALGYNAGSSLSNNESGNIYIGNTGVAGENNNIRIGTAQTSTFIAGVINGNGAGLTNLSVSALPANVALLSSNQTFTGSNSFSGGFSVLNSANNGGIILYDAGPATSIAIRNAGAAALAELGVAGATGNYSVNANTGDVTLRASQGGTQKLILQAGSGSANIVISNTTTTVLGTFNNNSDRDAKQDFAPVSPAEILDKVTHLPLTQWSYKTEVGTRHVGPMAQDFYSAFNIGTDDRHIAPIDEGGVSLAAIQGLNQKVDDHAKSLEQQIHEKNEEIQELKQRLNRLEKMFQQLATQQPGSQR